MHYELVKGLKLNNIPPGMDTKVIYSGKRTKTLHEFKVYLHIAFLAMHGKLNQNAKLNQMATAAGMLRKMRSIDLESVAGGVLSDNIPSLIEFQKKQLMQGKNNQGQLFSPKHSENPFFKKPGAGLKYAQWKQIITPETPFDIPNFFINGYYHGTIFIVISGKLVNTDATAHFKSDIDNVFQNTALGLNNDTKGEVWDNFLKSGMIHEIAPVLGCSIKNG